MKASTAIVTMRRRARAAHHGWMVRVLAVAVLFLAACGDDAAPPAAASGRGSSEGDAGADASSPASSVRRPDRGPRLPYADEEVELVPGASTTVRIEVNAGLGALDVQLSVDTTLSMSDEIDALQRDLENVVVTGLVARVPDVAFGVSRFEDFPAAPFGSPAELSRQRADTPFELLVPVTTDVGRVGAAVAALDQPLGLGGDNPESGAEALWQIATGGGYPVSNPALVDAFVPEGSTDSPGTIGGVGFRDGALRVVLHVTDAASHGPTEYEPRFPGTHTLDDAADALVSIDAKLVGVATRACPGPCPETSAARADLERVAHATGALVEADAEGRCPHGPGGESLPSYEGVCPLVFDVDGDGGGLPDTLVDAIAALVEGIRFDEVHGVTSDDPLGFVDGIVPVAVAQSGDRDAPEIIDHLPRGFPDGEPDAFANVRAQTTLGFEVRLVNRSVAPTDVAQRFRVVVRILGDGLVVQERTLRLVVPPAGAGGGALVGDGSDAG